jgi:transcriptional regulator with XRE-family HTH domain
MPISFATDDEICQQIIEGCRLKRIAMEMKQTDLAQKSGLSIATIKGFELGKSVNLMTLIKIMRALGELHRVENLVPELIVSPKSIFFEERPVTKKRVRRATP